MRDSVFSRVEIEWEKKGNFRNKNKRNFWHTIWWESSLWYGLHLIFPIFSWYNWFSDYFPWNYTNIKIQKPTYVLTSI